MMSGSVILFNQAYLDSQWKTTNAVDDQPESPNK